MEMNEASTVAASCLDEFRAMFYPLRKLQNDRLHNLSLNGGLKAHSDFIISYATTDMTKPF